jgi:hypothetical protein
MVDGALVVDHTGAAADIAAAGVDMVVIEAAVYAVVTAVIEVVVTVVADIAKLLLFYIIL